MIHIGFSYTGLIFLLMLFIPNWIWTKNKPRDYDNYVVNENKILLIFERVGEVLVTILSLIFSDFNVRMESLWSLWLVLAILLMIAYEGYWVRYFKSEKNMVDFYSSYFGVPVAGATLPVLAFLFLGIYGCNIFMIIATILLGIGHIGIHLAHRKEVCPPVRKGLLRKCIGYIVMILGIIVLLVICVSIGAKNYRWIKGSVKSFNGVDEEIYLELGGQKQYCVIRGENVDNPVIIWLHGGPASPDTMETFYISNYLKSDYTMIAYNQRGCGRTYYKNEEMDPNNATATFDQLVEDLDQLVDYACERFGQEKVIIVGHSFGTMLGCRYATMYPQKVAMYIGVGQMGRAGSDIYAVRDAIEIAQSMGDSTEQLQEALDTYINAPNIGNLQRMRSLADEYHKVQYTRDYILEAYLSPYMGVNDIRWYLKQMDLNKFVQLNEQLFDYAIGDVDVYSYGTEFAMPVGFISGSDDWVTPVKPMQDFYETVISPKKEIELIQGWGHTVPQENPEEFAYVLKDMIDKLK